MCLKFSPICWQAWPWAIDNQSEPLARIWDVSKKVKIRLIGQTDEYGAVEGGNSSMASFLPPHLDPYQGKYYVSSKWNII